MTHIWICQEHATLRNTEQMRWKRFAISKAKFSVLLDEMSIISQKNKETIKYKFLQTMNYEDFGNNA